MLQPSGQPPIPKRRDLAPPRNRIPLLRCADPEAPRLIMRAKCFPHRSLGGDHAGPQQLPEANIIGTSLRGGTAECRARRRAATFRATLVPASEPPSQHS